MTGFSADTFALLGELAAGRDKPWFEANRPRYEASLLGPMREFVTAVGPRLRAQIPELECRPQVNKTLTPINRDMRFARGQSPYKDHMLALFCREGRKKQDPQLFIGVQPVEVWAGLYLSPALIGPGSPMAQAVAGSPEAVVELGREAGAGEAWRLASCSRYGVADRYWDGSDAGHYLAGPHLCALHTYPADEVAADPAGFIESAADLLGRLVPLWKTYLEGL